ncbi:uncharacterized protein LAESUDRAFT_810921 [Laetiporus sulphureus 93-53]|uniref:Pentacotripeptide-repeat region of PRORP domain-containing protein n=1 Tax=Laetiporus sulphureus 93-53 TaxID=1314785 RepID=A0A165FQ93_9APHY|nr:uncharacterized protein LAESUDRAFT_810921 [Laetiporus sulphureus 93-53]KZT09313.1 hypothetical protein LAESUDRAFT_810921 [Laetiporus sulphureus 93-53]
MFIACDLAAAGMRVRSMEIVNALVQTHSVPPSAVYHANLMSTDFSLIVLTMSVHSALHLGWRSTAGKLMIKALLEGPEDSREIAALAAEVLRMLVDVPDESDSGFSASILVQLMTRYSSYPIPHYLIQAFYAGTQLLNQPHLAEVVYSVSFAPQIAYPPPQGRLLVWFMKHLTKKSKNAHLARQLATHVVEAQIPLPVLDRGRFIGLIASQGFATQARALWERYALVESSNDGNFVVGSAGAMLRVVSLFTSLARRERSARLDNAEEEEKLPDSEVVDMAASMPLEGEDEAFPPREFCWPAQGPRLEPAKSVSTGNKPQSVDPASSADVTRAGAPTVDPAALGEVHGATPSEPIGHDTLDTCPSGAADHPQEHVGAPPSEKVPAPDAASTATVIEDGEADFKEFATRVFKTYYASRRPLIHAHHFELNALARAAFMLGRLEEGLQIFQLMLKRRQVPDLVDVNVVLEMLAQYNPTAAARVLERMVTVGQTMGTLIRGLIETDEDRRNDSRHALKTVQDLVDLLLKAGQIPSPNMGRDCVIAAMRTEDAEAAFWFWDMLMRDKVEWEDEMQTKLRKAIARLVRRHWRAGRVMDVHARMMLVQMRERPIMGRGPGRRVPERRRKAAAGGGKKS